MGRQLPAEVIYRIRIRIESVEKVATIAEAVEVSKNSAYKIQLVHIRQGTCHHTPRHRRHPLQSAEVHLGPFNNTRSQEDLV
jgi:hypothetical protein